MKKRMIKTIEHERLDKNSIPTTQLMTSVGNATSIGNDNDCIENNGEIHLVNHFEYLVWLSGIHKLVDIDSTIKFVSQYRTAKVTTEDVREARKSLASRGLAITGEDVSEECATVLILMRAEYECIDLKLFQTIRYTIKLIKDDNLSIIQALDGLFHHCYFRQMLTFKEAKMLDRVKNGERFPRMCSDDDGNTKMGLFDAAGLIQRIYEKKYIKLKCKRIQEVC